MSNSDTPNEAECYSSSSAERQLRQGWFDSVAVAPAESASGHFDDDITEWEWD